MPVDAAADNETGVQVVVLGANRGVRPGADPAAGSSGLTAPLYERKMIFLRAIHGRAGGIH